MDVTTYFRRYRKTNGERDWARKLLSSELENCSLVQIWTKSEIGKVLGNLIMNGGSDCVDHLIG